MRAVKHLRLIAAELKLTDVRSQVGLSRFSDIVDGAVEVDARTRTGCPRCSTRSPRGATPCGTCSPPPWRSDVSTAEPPRHQRVLVIGLSPAKNEEVVASLRDAGIDAVGSTEPDTAAERYDASASR